MGYWSTSASAIFPHHQSDNSVCRPLYLYRNGDDIDFWSTRTGNQRDPNQHVRPPHHGRPSKYRRNHHCRRVAIHSWRPYHIGRHHHKRLLLLRRRWILSLRHTTDGRLSNERRTRRVQHPGGYNHGLWINRDYHRNGIQPRQRRHPGTFHRSQRHQFRNRLHRWRSLNLRRWSNHERLLGVDR